MSGLVAFFALLSLSVCGPTLARETTSITSAPLAAYPNGEIRITTTTVYEGRADTRRATGEIAYQVNYYAGPDPKAPPLGELSFKLGHETVKWGRIDSHDEGKGIASTLYRHAVNLPEFCDVKTITTTWTDSNYDTYRNHRLEGLDVMSAARKTHSAITFDKLGWELDQVVDKDIMRIVYRRKVACAFHKLSNPKD